MNEQTSNELVKYLSETELDQNKQQNLLQAFNDLFKQASDLIFQADQINVTNETQLEEMKHAREIRLALVKVRTAIDKKHEIFTKDNVLYKRALDGLRAIGRALTQPKERELEAKEKFIENKENERKTQLKANRLTELQPFYSDFDELQSQQELSYHRLDEMPEDMYRRFLENAKQAFAKREDDRKKAEKERIEKEENERLERERIQLENEKLRQARDERARREVIGRDRQNKLFAIKITSDFAELCEMSEAEFKKLYTQKSKEFQAEQTRIAEEKRIADEQLAKERAEKARIETELNAKKETEAKQLADEKARKLAPDKEKLIALAESINNLDFPTLSNPEAQTILDTVRVSFLSKAVSYLTEKANKM